MKDMCTAPTLYSPGEAQKVDAVFRSLHFEKMELPSDLQGTPMDEYRMLVREIDDSGQEIEALDRKTGEMFSERAPRADRSQEPAGRAGQ